MNLTGGIEVSGASPELESKLRARSDFIAAYCQERGWNAEDLSLAQVMEIRCQDGWKNAR